VRVWHEDVVAVEAAVAAAAAQPLRSPGGTGSRRRAGGAPREAWLEVLLPTQWRVAGLVSTGPRRLALALLEDAVRCLRARPRPSDGTPAAAQVRAWQAEAQAWFAAADHTPAGFGWVCDALGLEPDAVRRKLAAARRRYRRADRGTSPRG
jgi:hypothetical protein